MGYIPIRLSGAGTPGLARVEVSPFLGVDLTNQPSNVDLHRSPDAANMIRDVPGKVRKRMGWHTLHTFEGRVNGFHTLTGADPLLHAGTALYKLPGGMAGFASAGPGMSGANDGQRATQAPGGGPATSDAVCGANAAPAGGAASVGFASAGPGISGANDGQRATQAPGPVLLYQGAADGRSKSWQFNGKTYIADGLALLVYDGETVKKASEDAKIPVTTIGKPPKGGGEQYEDLNLLQPKFQEMFLGTTGDKVYQLSFGELDDDPVEVELLQKDGTWLARTEKTHFSVDRAGGKVTFTAAPGVSPVAGQDNVKITASRTVKGYADRINRCRFGIPFGVNGAADRLFLAGNPDFVNQDWYSRQNDPAYWGDTAYSVLGQADSAIVGYSIVNDRLAAHKNAVQAERNVIVREGNLVDSRPSFPIVNVLQGEGAVAPYSFAYLCNEPLFLTRLGIYAITPADITGERYAQNRSFYLNGRLLEEPGLEDAFALVYKDMYWLCLNGAVYILDGLQSAATDKGAPYSTRQYVGFYCTNIPARVMWQQDGALYFGSEGGQVRAFYTEPSVPASYSDDGEAIYACWRTPDLQGRSFYRSKNFYRLSVELASSVVTSLRAWARVEGIWEPVMESLADARYFSYERLSYSKFSYSNDDTPRTLSEKLRVRGVDKAGFKLENGEPGEPFGLENVSLEFTETGYYR